jgi:hypothetical protein
MGLGNSAKDGFLGKSTGNPRKSGVHRDERNPKLLVSQHHGVFGRKAKRTQKIGVAREWIPPGLKARFMNGSCN